MVLCKPLWAFAPAGERQGISSSNPSVVQSIHHPRFPSRILRVGCLCRDITGRVSSAKKMPSIALLSYLENLPKRAESQPGKFISGKSCQWRTETKHDSLSLSQGSLLETLNRQKSKLVMSETPCNLDCFLADDSPHSSTFLCLPEEPRLPGDEHNLDAPIGCSMGGSLPPCAQRCNFQTASPQRGK